MTEQISTDPLTDPLTDPVTDPVTDMDRLIEIGSYDLESCELRQILDTYARTAAERLGLPVGLVTIVLDGAQFLAGQFGLQDSWIGEVGGTPVEWSFCATAVRSRVPYVVTDATKDPRQETNPLVVMDGIRSYAGAPLTTGSGHVLGSCCAIGFEPHEFSPADVEILQELATEVVEELSRHRL